MLPRAFIATPAYAGMVHATYVLGLLQLQTELGRRGAPGIVTSFIVSESLISRARNEFVASFRKTDCGVLLFIDADIAFRAEHVVPLLTSGLDVVGAAYPRKRLPAPPFVGADNFVVNLFPEDVKRGEYRIATTRDGERFVEVLHVGTGMLAIRRHVIDKMIEAHPELAYKSDDPFAGTAGEERHDLFSVGVDPESQRLLSEDYSFEKRWRELGGKVHVHLGPELGHVGQHTFTGRFGAIFDPPGVAVPKPAAAAPAPTPAAVAPNRQQRRAMAAQGGR